MLTRRAVLALSGVALFLGGQLGTFAHLAFEEHAVCPEHGEVVHAGHAEPATHEVDGPSLFGEGEHEHDECLIAIAPRTPAAATAAHAELPEPPALIEAPAALAAAHQHRPFSRRYLQAPKQSPPA